MSTGANSGVLATLNDEYQIFAEPAPLPDGSRGECMRAGVVGRTEPPLFALLGTAVDCFRMELAQPLQTLQVPGLQAPLAHGVIDYRGNEQRFALVMPRMAGTPLSAVIGTQKPRFGESEIVDQILPQLLRLLKMLAENGIFHGGLRSDNLYLSSAGMLTLGECISTTPSLLQPTNAQTVERAMTKPALRGSGTPADEMFSLGVLLAHMALGQMPLGEMTEAEALALRLERGSFNAMVGRQPLSNGLIDILNGLLEDEAGLRWPVDTLERYIQGRHTTGVKSRTRYKPARALMVGEVECWDTASVAQAFNNNQAEALRLVANDELIKWVRRTLKDVETAERIADAVNMPSLKGKASAYEACMIARICIALDPGGPIRYQGLALMPDAIGSALQKTYALGESPQILAEIVAAQLPKYWYNSQAKAAPNHLLGLKSLESARVSLERAQPGGGLERCLYEMAPGCPLLAPEFKGRLVTSIAQFLPELERVAGTGNRPAMPLNRHSAAFFLSREAEWTRAINSFSGAATDAGRAHAALSMLATLQKKTTPGKLPNIGKWLLPLIQPVLERFHNRETRNLVRAELEKAAADGELTRMYGLLENNATQQNDRNAFALARQEYAALAHNIRILHDRTKPGAALHSRLANEAAAAVAGLVAGIAILGTLLIKIGMT